MRSLLPPTGELGPDAVEAAYAWPDRPWLRVNMVESLDGAVVAPDGLSKAISTPADTRLFSALRGRADALLVGAGTVRAERYRGAAPKQRLQDARKEAGQRPAPVVAVVTRSLALDPSSDLFTAAVERPIVLTVRAADAAARAAISERAEVVDCGEKEVDLVAAVEALRERGLTWVHCEGGPTLLGALAAADLIDEWCVSVTPHLAGGSYPDGTSPSRMVSGPPLPHSPAPLTLQRVLEDEGTLFLDYGRPR